MTIQHLLKTAPVTTLLLISFIGLFIMQVVTGVDANNPSTEALLFWGANELPLTMNHESWRLVSSAFLHIGLMHLLFNGFAMYFCGQVAEPMFGSATFLGLFLLAAIGGNLLNSHITWVGIMEGTGQMGLAAGASGGIMGIGGALLIAALFKISINGMVLNLKSLILIMGINLLYGFAVSGIDNAGHIGGALTGLVIAVAFAVAYRQRLAATQATVANTTPYQTNSDRAVTVHTRFENEGNFDNNRSFKADSAVNLPINSYANINDAMPNPASLNHANFHQQQTATQSPLIWQLLPWVVMMLISIGFIGWWQHMHQQILSKMPELFIIIS